MEKVKVTVVPDSLSAASLCVTTIPHILRRTSVFVVERVHQINTLYSTIYKTITATHWQLGFSSIILNDCRAGLGPSTESNVKATVMCETITFTEAAFSTAA